MPGLTASASARDPASCASTTASSGGDGKPGSSGVATRPPGTVAAGAPPDAGAVGADDDGLVGPGTLRTSVTATTIDAAAAASAAIAAPNRRYTVTSVPLP